MLLFVSKISKYSTFILNFILKHFSVVNYNNLCLFTFKFGNGLGDFHGFPLHLLGDAPVRFLIKRFILMGISDGD